MELYVIMNALIYTNKSNLILNYYDKWQNNIVKHIKKIQEQNYPFPENFDNIIIPFDDTNGQCLPSKSSWFKRTLNRNSDTYFLKKDDINKDKKWGINHNMLLYWMIYHIKKRNNNEKNYIWIKQKK